MTTLRNYNPTDSLIAVELWNAAIGGEFPMDIRLWRQNVDLCPELVLPASFVAEEDGAVVGVIVAKAPAKICCLIVSPAFHRHGIGSLLLQAAADVLATSGAERIILGQDLRHFFPGVPECLTSARKFFARRGFQWGGGYANDLMRSLADYTMPESVLTAISGLAARGISIQPCRDQHVPSLLKQISQHGGLQTHVIAWKLSPLPKRLWLLSMPLAMSLAFPTRSATNRISLGRPCFGEESSHHALAGLGRLEWTSNTARSVWGLPF
jgi:GNAT superfamily N-acetyltransferase